MPGNMTSVTLRPGVNLEPSQALNEAGISDSQLIRTKNGLTQTMGGWQQFGMTIPSTVRDLHCWQDIRAIDHVVAGATANLVALTPTTYQDITPLSRISSAPPDISTSSGSFTVTINDVNAGVTIIDTIQFLTPISVSNLLLEGAYPVTSVISTGSFTITSSVAAATTVVSSGELPAFVTTANSAFVGVQQSNHTEGTTAILGLLQNFDVPTTVGGIIIEGDYNVASIGNSSSYSILSPTAASANATVPMNNGVARYVYWTTTAPISGAVGYGGGPYGGGAYGSGATPVGDPGTPITATDWTLDNWGEILLSCTEDGPIFQWSPTISFSNAQIVAEAPLKNGGIFVSMPQQILVAWKSILTQGNGGFNNGGSQDNLIVRWSDAQNFQQWDVSDQTAAGSFHIPTGSVLRGGLQAPNFGVVWTDIDCWIMQYTNDPVSVFNFTKAGSGCGLIGKHAAGVLSGQVMWASDFNFFMLGGAGTEVIPCTVWDFVFQNLNQALDPNGVPYKRRMCAGPNSAFNEMAWFFPTPDSTENNAFVKYNIADKTWDKGFLTRTAWEDVSVVGNPVATDTGAILWQHEEGNVITGAGNSYFKTGWWAISDGEELAFVDYVLPDFIWGTYGNTSGSVQITFFSVDYPGDTPRVYGPFTVTQQNQYITPRIRGRLVSMQVVSASNNVFWRLGKVRFRFAASGKR